jgi:hypothetical protein
VDNRDHPCIGSDVAASHAMTPTIAPANTAQGIPVKRIRDLKTPSVNTTVPNCQCRPSRSAAAIGRHCVHARTLRARSGVRDDPICAVPLTRDRQCRSTARIPAYGKQQLSKPRPRTHGNYYPRESGQTEAARSRPISPVHST